MALNFRRVIAASFVSIANPVHAGIICDGPFQVVRGTAISTPFCHDEEIAAEVRRRGGRVSGGAIRRSEELKRKACAGEINISACASQTSD